VTVRRATGETFKVVAHDTGTDDVEINSGSAIEEGDVVMIATCKSAAVFQVTSAVSGTLGHSDQADSYSDTPDNSTNDLGTGYANGDLFQIDTVTYYIRNGNNNRPALYRKIGNSDAQELIQDVEDMQITYGEDTNMDALVDRYVTADVVANWDNVISVNVNLLLVTPEDNLTPSGPQAYVFNGVKYDGVDGPLPADNRLRRAFSSTITLRNRTL
jgi:type IV pilus assembly protein PilW